MTTNTKYEKNKTNFAEFIPAYQIIIKPKISEASVGKFNENIKRLEENISPDTKYLIVKLFVQIGQPEEDSRVMNYIDKNNTDIFIQPKIKNYVEFKTKESAERYRDDELSDTDLYLFLEVGKFGIGIK